MPLGRFFILLLITLLIPTTSARAQELSESERGEARALFEAGRVAFEAGRFEDALAHFERSYAISSLPELLYNIGQAADRMRNDVRALEAFEEYLRLRPDSDDRGAIEARITAIRGAVAARAPVESPDEPGDDGAIDDTAVGAAGPPGEEEQTASGADPGGWIVLGIGGAAAIAGAVLLGLADAAAQEVRSASAGTPWTDVRDAHASADTFGIAGAVLLAVGVAAIGAGLVWGIIGLSDGETEVAIGPGSVALRGRFR